jgi:MFS family permease
MSSADKFWKDVTMETRRDLNAQRPIPSRDIEEDKLYRKIAWRLVPLLFVCYIVAYIDRINIGVAKLQMLGDLSFNNAVYAFGASVFFWGYVVLEVPSNILLNRVGARVWIARIMISWGTVSTAIAFVKPLADFTGLPASTMFYILRFLLGACEAGFAPGVVLYLSYWFPSNRQSQILGGFFLAVPVGTMIGAPLSGWILDALNGAANVRGWQWVFIVEGLPAIALGCFVLAWLRDRPEKARWLTDAEKTVVCVNLTWKQAEKRHEFSASLTDLRIWIMSAIFLLYGTGFYGLAFWLPTIIQSSGVVNSFHVGLLNAIPYAIAALYMTWHAAHARKTGERRMHTVLPILIGGLGLVASAVFSEHIVVSLFFTTVAVCGLMSVMTVFWTLPTGFLSGTAAATGIAFISSIGSLSGIVGAFASSIALEMTGTMKSGTYLLGALMVLSGILAFLAPRSMYGTIKPPTANASDVGLAFNKTSCK